MREISRAPRPLLNVAPAYLLLRDGASDNPPQGEHSTTSTTSHAQRTRLTTHEHAAPATRESSVPTDCKPNHPVEEMLAFRFRNPNVDPRFLAFFHRTLRKPLRMSRYQKVLRKPTFSTASRAKSRGFRFAEYRTATPITLQLPSGQHTRRMPANSESPPPHEIWVGSGLFNGQPYG